MCVCVWVRTQNHSIHATYKLSVAFFRLAFVLLRLCCLLRDFFSHNGTPNVPTKRNETPFKMYIRNEYEIKYISIKIRYDTQFNYCVFCCVFLYWLCLCLHLIDNFNRMLPCIFKMALRILHISSVLYELNVYICVYLYPNQRDLVYVIDMNRLHF